LAAHERHRHLGSIELDELPRDSIGCRDGLTHAPASVVTAENVKVDICRRPNLRRAVPSLAASGNEMSLLGQRLAFEQARDMQWPGTSGILVGRTGFCF